MSFERCDKAFVEKYIKLTDALIEEIENSPTTVEVTGKKYYVSNEGNDENDGLSPETPWKTVARVNRQRFRYGDGVFFKRGDTFRQTYALETNNGVTYSAYGEGKKPRLVGSVDASGADKWIKTEYENIYAYAEKIPAERDVGNIIFDGGRAWGIQVPKRKRAPGHEIGHVFNGLEWIDAPDCDIEDFTVLNANLEYQHDWESETLYLYSRDGNPGELFKSIELSDKGPCIHVGFMFTDVTVDNIEMYGGSFGISGGSVNGLTVQYCTFKWIGGSIQGYYEPLGIPIRYGNAVESYGCSENFTIHHCYATQVYDCCWTIQDGSAVVIRNLKMHDNVAEYSNTGLEIWQNGGLFDGMELYNNHTRYNGYGWSHQRENKDANFFYGASAYAAVYKNCSIHDNVNYLSQRYGLLARPAGPKQYNFNNNLYIMEEGTLLGRLAENPATGEGDWVNYEYTEENINKFQADGFEPGSKYYMIEKSPLAEDMYTLGLPKDE
jgi:hypothetical protein